MGAVKRTLALLAAILAVSFFNIWTVSRQLHTPETESNRHAAKSLLGVPQSKGPLEESEDDQVEDNTSFDETERKEFNPTAKSADDNTNGEDNENENDNHDNIDNDIRSWGCDLTETPLIFVHNGKSGGGNIRARLAAAALHYSRPPKHWSKPHLDHHYYPIKFDKSNSNSTTTQSTATRKGRFCHSQYPHYTDMPHIATPLTHATYEGLEVCNATTPLGIAVACHHPHKQAKMGRRGGIKYPHYRNTNCGACDDDYYLEQDYFFPTTIDANFGRIDNSYPSLILNETVILMGNHSSSSSSNGSSNNDTINTQRLLKDRVGKRRRKSKSKTSTKPSIPKFKTRYLDPQQDPPPTCDTVLAAHNNMGSELHWLPPRYLKELWWDQSEFANTNAAASTLNPYWDKLLDDRHRRRYKLRAAHGKSGPTIKSGHEKRWCPKGYTVDQKTLYDRPATPLEYQAAYETCGRELAMEADRAFFDAFPNQNFSPFYASMPVHRVTIVRDPWAWIISKFFWHGLEKIVPWKVPNSIVVSSTSNMTEMEAEVAALLNGTTANATIAAAAAISNNDNTNTTTTIPPVMSVREATKRTDLHPTWLPCYDITAAVSSKSGQVIPLDPLSKRPLGWMEQYALNFLIKLCGDDCRTRYENGMMGLPDIEAQVASNLKQAFSVVGILHEQDTFYDMLTDRIQYLNMSLHPEVTGKSHATPKTEANQACKELFKNETFRQEVREQVPAFGVLEKMYHLAVKVNAFQKEEIAQCKRAKGEEPTRGTYR